MKHKNISKKSKIEKNCSISKDSILIGENIVGENCVIENQSNLDTCVLEKNVKIRSSTLETSEIGEGTTIGPYAHLREKNKIGKNCKIGNFVEIKQSVLGDNTKVSHLAYVGNATIGSNCNIGCGVIFANYDGKNKHPTIIGDNCFIGSNCTLIAPVTIGEGSFLCAGTVITENVPPNTFVIGRSRQINKEGRAEKYLKKK